MKVYNDRSFGKLLKNNGYKLDRTCGSHFIYVGKSGTISVNRNLNRMVAQRLIKQYGLEVG